MEKKGFLKKLELKILKAIDLKDEIVNAYNVSDEIDTLKSKVNLCHYTLYDSYDLALFCRKPEKLFNYINEVADSTIPLLAVFKILLNQNLVDFNLAQRYFMELVEIRTFCVAWNGGLKIATEDYSELRKFIQKKP
ncbi:MAG: hypothetical protein WCQ95_04755 [Bacteroidota bacterium]